MSIQRYDPTSSDYAGLFRAGLRGYARLRQNQMVQKTLPLGVSAIQDMKIRALQKAVGKFSPHIESLSLAPASLVVNANSTVAFDYSISTQLPANAEFASKYLGDKFRNKTLDLRILYSEVLDTARCVVYMPRTVGDTLSLTDLQTIPDETKYRVLYDTVMFPKHSNQPRRNLLFKRINLSDRLTTVDRTAATTGSIKANEIRVAMIATNPTATAVSIQPWYKLRFQNK